MIELPKQRGREITINPEILAVKPSTIENPKALVADEKLGELRSIERLAIGEIAGRDSMAAIIEACRAHDVKAIVPTIVYTGTEYGDWQTPVRNIEFLKASVGSACGIHDSIVIGSPELWAALNGRYATVIVREYGIYSPCMACHLYMHLCRVPLSKVFGSVPIISGERNSHQGCIKLSQTPAAIDASAEVLTYAGIELMLPIRHIEDNSGIEEIIGPGWEQGQRQLHCVLSGNYSGLDKEVAYDTSAHERYIKEFLIPCGKAVVDAWRTAPSVDYNEIVKSILKDIVGRPL